MVSEGEKQSEGGEKKKKVGKGSRWKKIGKKGGKTVVF